jgi:hypothetical protein
MTTLTVNYMNRAIRLTGLSVHYAIDDAGFNCFRFRDAVTDKFVGSPMTKLPTMNELASVVRAAIADRDGVSPSAQ